MVGLLVLPAVFWLLERFRPSLPGQRRQTADTRVDVAYWFFTPLVTRFVTRISVGVVFVLIALPQGVTLDELRRLATTRRTWASSLPLIVQVPLILLLADLLAYWSHRLFHGQLLWRFHAIHHSSKTVDWLSSVRLHPVNDAISRIAQVLPLYVDGFRWRRARSVRTIPHLLRAPDSRQRELELRAVPVSPRQPCVSPLASHDRRRRTRQELRRTLSVHRSRLRHLLHATGRQPQRFGLTNDDLPSGLVAQLAYPFRRK